MDKRILTNYTKGSMVKIPYTINTLINGKTKTVVKHYDYIVNAAGYTHITTLN